MHYIGLVPTREQKRHLVALSAPTVLMIGFGVLDLTKSFRGGDMFDGILGLVLLAGAFFLVFEIGRQAGRL